MNEDMVRKLANTLNNGNFSSNSKNMQTNFSSSKNSGNSNTPKNSEDNSTNSNLDFNSIFESIKNSSNFETNSNNSTNNSNDNSSNPFSNIDIGTIMKIKTIMDKMNNQKDDPRSNLLLSLKPYLKPSRKEKVDQYVKIFGMTQIFDGLNFNGGESKK